MNDYPYLYKRLESDPDFIRYLKNPTQEMIEMVSEKIVLQYTIDCCIRLSNNDVIKLYLTMKQDQFPRTKKYDIPIIKYDIDYFEKWM